MFYSLREMLYLPLGLIPAIFFAARLSLQWFQSEKAKKSYVGNGFWKLSILGNISLLLHHIVQVQYPFAIIQGINAVISWRNIDLIKKKAPYRTKTVIGILFLFLFFITFLFLAQSYLFSGEMDWIRTPMKPWDKERQYDSFYLHALGTLGSIIFSCRFWIQWYFAERKKSSELNQTFWWLSILGSAILIYYTTMIGDYVLFFYNCFGLIPYIRNLILIREQKKYLPS